MFIGTILFTGKLLLAWIALAVAAFAYHLYSKNYIALSVAIGALCTTVAYLIGYSGLLTQALVFAITTLIFVISFLPVMIRQSEEKRVKQQVSDFKLRGQVATVTETIDNMAAKGKVILDGQEYIARSVTGNVKEIGMQVKVLDHDRDILLVR